MFKKNKEKKAKPKVELMQPITFQPRKSESLGMYGYELDNWKISKDHRGRIEISRKYSCANDCSSFVYNQDVYCYEKDLYSLFELLASVVNHTK
jgi:hypothetical protein